MEIKKFKNFIDMPLEIKALSDIFQKNNKKLYIVGGFIRDKLMGLHPLDIDLSTDSLPNETISFLKDKYKIDFVGKAFGVVIVHIDKIKIEIASFRKDISIGRHPKVELGVSIEDDVRRRDLTISSIFYDIQENKIVDLVGGVNDIRNKIIRMVGDPIDRINEDQLRSLRAIRFACRYNFSIDKKTFSVLKKYTDLSKISRERIWEEIYKSFKQCGNRFVDYLKYFNDLEIWDQIFPGIEINENIIKCTSLEIYLSNLFKNNIADNFNVFQNNLVQKYLIPIEIARSITFLIWFQSFDPEKIVEYYSKKNNYGIDNKTIKEWIIVSNLSDRKFNAFIKYKPTSLAIDLMNKGFKGAELGREIRRIEIDKFNKMIISV